MSAVVIVLLAGAGCVACVFHDRGHGVPPAEINYQFELADENGDRLVSREEWVKFGELRTKLAESDGQLKVSVESHSLYEAKEDEMSEAEREEFMKRTRAKDAPVE